MKRSYLILLLLGVLTTVILSLLSFFSFTELFQSMHTRREMVRQRENLVLLLSDFKDAETGQRGYIITGFNDYLEPYYQALKNIEEHYRLLEAGLSTPRDYSLFQELSRLMQLKLDELDDRIQIRNSQGFEAARAKVADREGKRYMDHIRILVDEMLNDQDQRLKAQEESVKTWSDRSFWLNFLAGILNIFLVGLFSFLFYRDAKKLMQVKQQFKETYGLYEAILNSAKQVIITTDAQGIVTSFNKGAEKALGYRVDEVIGKMSILTFYSRSKTQGKAQEITSKTAQFQHSEFETLVAPSRYLVWTDAEWIMKKKNGVLFPCLQSITALRDELEGVKGYLFIGSDLTDRKKGEQDLQSARQAVEAVQLSKNQFLASFSYDLKAPLNSIMNFSQLLMRNLGGNLKEQDITYVTRISENCRSILNLLNEMLIVSKQENILPPLLITTSIVLTDLIKKVLEGIAPAFKDIQFNVEIPEDAQPLETDVNKFSVLLSHLIQHAVDELKQGLLTIRVKINPQTQQPIEIEVIQNEISPDLEKPSPPLAEVSQKAEGHLVKAQALADQIGYQIKVTNRLGRGAVYCLILHPPISLVDESVELSSKPLQGMKNSPVLPTKLTILVIEDDLDFQSILKAYLQELGCQVLTAASGEEGIRLAKAYPIDFVIMDMIMAPMNGYDIVRKLQDDPELKHIPFAFISVIAKEIQGKVPGALAFLNKPIKKEDVAALIQKYQMQHRYS